MCLKILSVAGSFVFTVQKASATLKDKAHGTKLSKKRFPGFLLIEALFFFL